MRISSSENNAFPQVPARRRGPGQPLRRPKILLPPPFPGAPPTHSSAPRQDPSLPLPPPRPWDVRNTNWPDFPKTRSATVRRPPQFRGKRNSSSGCAPRKNNERRAHRSKRRAVEASCPAHKAASAAARRVGLLKLGIAPSPVFHRRRQFISAHPSEPSAFSALVRHHSVANALPAARIQIHTPVCAP